MRDSTKSSAPHTPVRRSYWIQSLDLALWLARWARKLVVLVLGLSVVAVGIVMFVTPGPAILVIPLGLAILATEFFWAKRLLKWLRNRLHERIEALRRKDTGP